MHAKIITNTKKSNEESALFELWITTDSLGFYNVVKNMGWQRIKDKNLVCKKIVDEINNQKLLRTKSACQAKKLKRVIKRYKRSCNGSEQKLSDRKSW